MIGTFYEHTFDPDLIAPGDWVLDVGCRGYDIPKMLGAKGVNVVAVDADPNLGTLAWLTNDTPRSVTDYVRPVLGRAVVGMAEHAQRKTIKLDVSGNPYAFSVRTGGPKTVEVFTATVPGLMAEYCPKDLSQLALLKLDCEGAEYGIIDDVVRFGANGRHVARQVTVEFHDHCGIPSPPGWIDALEGRMSDAGYDCLWPEPDPDGSRIHVFDSFFLLRRHLWR